MELVSRRGTLALRVAAAHGIFLVWAFLRFRPFIDLQGLHPAAWFEAQAAPFGLATCLAALGVLLARLLGAMGAWAQGAWVIGTTVGAVIDHALYRVTRLHIQLSLWPMLKQDDIFGMLGIGASEAIVLAAYGMAVALAVGLVFWLAKRSQRTTTRFESRLAAVVLTLALAERAAYAVIAPCLLMERSDPAVILPMAGWLSPKLPTETVQLVFGWPDPYAQYASLGALSDSRAGPIYPAPALGTWQPSPGPKKNILLIGIESFRADSLSAQTTPQLWALAAEAQRATRHYSTANCTHLGLFSLLSGLSPRMWSVATEGNLPLATYEVLRRSGYEVVAASSDAPRWFGLHRQVLKRELSLGPFEGAPDRDRALIDAVIAKVQQPREKPFFVFAFLNGTHYPYAVGDGTVTSGTEQAISPLDPDIRNKAELLRERYRESLRFVDLKVGRLLTALRQSGLLDSTIVAVTGDHGESFFDDGTLGHGSVLSEAQLRVPLLIRVPNKEPSDLSGISSHVDVLPTLMGEAGIDAPIDAFSDGVNLFTGAGRTALCAQMATGEPQDFGVIVDDGIIRFRQVGSQLRFEASAVASASKNAASVMRTLQWTSRWVPGVGHDR